MTALRLAAMTLACSAAAFAHHSFSAEFDAKKTIHLRGTIKGIDWSNPHTTIYLNVPAGEGRGADRAEEWTIEGAAPGAMMRRGLRKGDFRTGETIAIDGEQARDGSNRINGLSVTLEDGRTLSLRNAPAASLSLNNSAVSLSQIPGNGFFL